MAESIYRDGTYLATHPTWHSEHSEWKAGQILKAIELARLNPKNVAEIGCGAGAILAYLRKRLPADYSGYDISPQALTLAHQHEHEGISFHAGSVEAISHRYNLVLAIDVIEHVEDVFSFLRKLRGCGDSFIFHIPLDLSCVSMIVGTPMNNRKAVGHLHYFTKDTALATLQECGYSIQHWFYTPCVDLFPGFPTLVRRIVFRLSPDYAVKIVGGYSMMVVAR